MEIKLAGKLVKILDSLASVPKKGYNIGQKYHYMREVDVLEALKKELVEKKIIMLTSSNHVQTEKRDRTDKHGNIVTEFLVTVHTTHTFIDSESGEQLSITSVGSGIDQGDKSASKAITAATKYALLKTFMISDEGADIENDGSQVAAPQVNNTPTKTMFSKLAAAKKEEQKQEVPVEAPKLESKEFKPKLSKFDAPAKVEAPKPETKPEPVKAVSAPGSLLSKMNAAKSSPAFKNLGKPGLIDDPEFK